MMSPLTRNIDDYKVITFYSFKGGAGRSVSTINTVAAMVLKHKPTKENPFLVIDMDIDSAGITYLCGADQRTIKSKMTSGAILSNEIDFTNGRQSQEIRRLFRENRKYIPEKLIHELEKSKLKDQAIEWLKSGDLYEEIIDFLECNHDDSSLILALNGSSSITQFMYAIESRADWKCLMDISYIVGASEPESVLFLGADILCEGVYAKAAHRYLNVLESFSKECKKRKFKAMFIDSASGRQTISEVARDISNKFVVCLRMTTQFQEGTFNYLEYLCKKEGDRDIILLPVAVPQNNPKRINNAKLEMKTKWDRLQSSDMKIDKKCLVKYMVDEGGIPEVDSFKWQEEVLVPKSLREEELEEDEILAMNAYTRLCDVLGGEVEDGTC